MRSAWLLGFLWIPSSLPCSQAFAPEPKPLGLRAFLEKALHNVSFQQLLIRELRLHPEYLSRVAMNEVVVELGSDYDVVLGGTSSQGSNLQMNVKLSRLFWGTGSSGFVEFRTTNPTSSLRSSRVSVGVAQDIVRNAFGKSERLRVRSAALQKQMALYELAEAYEDTLSSLVSLYLDWADAKADADLAIEIEGTYKALLSNTERRFRSGIADLLERNKATMALLSRSETTLEKQRQLNNYTIEVLEAMEVEGDFVPDHEPLGSRGGVDLSASMATFLREGRTLKILSLVKEEAKQDLLLRRQGLLPSVRLSMQMDFLERSGLGWANAPINLNVGGSFLWRLWDKGERARGELAQLTLRQRQANERQKNLSLRRQLATLKSRIEVQERRLRMGERRQALAEEVASETKRRYRQGRSSIASVLSEERSLENLRYQNLYRRFAIDKLMLEWKRLTDVLVVRRGGKLVRARAEPIESSSEE